MKTAILPRGYLWARIPTEAGDLLFLNTHLSAWRNEEGERTNQVGHLLAFGGGHPRFVVVGDLNARPDLRPVRVLEQAGLADLPTRVGKGQTSTFPAGNPLVRLDYILGGHGVEPLSAAVPETEASDHRPVVVRVRLR